MGARSRDAKATITPYRDGPLLVRGGFRLQDQEGNEIAHGRETIALCRCGRSRMRPFCDGSHKLVGFRAPSARENGRPKPAGQGSDGARRAGGSAGEARES